MLTKEQEGSLAELRERIKAYIGGRRLTHTYAVEREITSLSEIYAPEGEYTLRAAALLHDITKELSHEKQLQLCHEFGIIYTETENLTPKIFHAMTAPAVIKRDFPEFASDEVLSAVRWHTTGHDSMTLFEMLLFLADYIEDTRTFEDCIKLRKYFYDGAENESASCTEHLCDTMIMAFDNTISELVAAHAPINISTVDARNYFVCQNAKKIKDKLKPMP